MAPFASQRESRVKTGMRRVPTPNSVPPDHMTSTSGLPKDSLLYQLLTLVGQIQAFEQKHSQHLEKVLARHVEGARNLLHYLALNGENLNHLEMELSSLGLGTIMSDSLPVSTRLEQLVGWLKLMHSPQQTSGTQFMRSSHNLRFQRALHHKEIDLLGTDSTTQTAVMVTLPQECAENPDLIVQLLNTGVSCLRVNCGQYPLETCENMAKQVRLAERRTGQQVKVLMDLPGSKIRTAALAQDAQTCKLSPVRSPQGHVNQPLHILFTNDIHLSPDQVLADHVLPLKHDFNGNYPDSGLVRFCDSRGKRRVLRIVSASANGFIAELHQTAYINDQTQIRVTSTKLADQGAVDTHLHALPSGRAGIQVREGDFVILRNELVECTPARHDRQGRLLAPATLGCTPSELFKQVRQGDPVYFDDGKIAGEAHSVLSDQIYVRITRTSKGKSLLKGNAGINFPHTAQPPFTAHLHDRKTLAFVAKHADIIGLSFLNDPNEMVLIKQELERLGAANLGVVLKIETYRAFQQLPMFLLKAMRMNNIGVMIARGDLAVECGWKKLAHCQRQILQVCKTANVPVIWATQVLDQMNKKGVPTRAEVSDVMMGAQASCIMLNKGPYLLETVDLLNSLLHKGTPLQSSLFLPN